MATAVAMAASVSQSGFVFDRRASPLPSPLPPPPLPRRPGVLVPCFALLRPGRDSGRGGFLAPCREAYLTALFSVARLLSKTVGLRPQDRVPDLRAALTQYGCLAAVARAVVPPGSTLFAEELRAAQEIASMLPAKIDAIHFRGADIE
jgi:hypothetical protein